MSSGSICDVPGILVGHAQNDDAKTGCTVVVPEQGAVGGIDVRGSAPGTREIETLKPVRLVPQIHALLLTGGSAFGLDASGGVQQYLEERDIGFDVGVTRVPIVPSAVIFDLREGDPAVRPDKEMGYLATSRASRTAPAEGRVGAGRGATVGKILGHENCMKGGIGTCSETVGESTIGALAVVNPLGDVVSPRTGQIVAGARDRKSGTFADCEKYLREHPDLPFPPTNSNTTLGVIATDAELTKEDCIKVAEMAQDGLSRAIRPAHTPFDGDLVFCLSVGQKQGNVMTLGSVAANLMAEAIVRAVTIANELK